MFPLRAVASFLLISLVLASPVVAREDKTPLPLIPSDFGLIVKISSPKTTIDRAKELIDHASKDLGEQVTLLQGMLESMCSNPGLIGVNPASDVWIAVRFRSGEVPEYVFLVEIFAEKDFRESIGEAFSVHNSGKWTAYSESSELIDLFKSLEKGNGRALSKFVDPNCLEILTRGDLAIWADLQSMRNSFEQEIEFWKSNLESGVQALSNGTIAQEGFHIESQFNLQESILDAGKKLLEDSRAFCGNIVFARGGIVFDNYLSFSYASDTVKSLKTMAVSDFKLIDKLPKSHLFYCGINGFTGELVKWGMHNSSMLFTAEPAKQAFANVSRELEAISFGALLMSMDIGATDEGLTQMVTILETDHPETLRGISHDLIGLMGEMEQSGMKFTSKLTPEGEDYGGLMADIIDTEFHVSDLSSPQGLMQQQMLNSFYGPEGAKTRYFYFKDHVLQVVGSRESVEEAVAAHMGRSHSRKTEPRNGPDVPSSDDQQNQKDFDAPTEAQPTTPSLKRDRKGEERSALFMLVDSPDSHLLAQNDEDNDGGGLFNLKKLNPQNLPKQNDLKSEKKSSTPSGSNPKEILSETPSETLIPTSPFPAPHVENGPWELPPRDADKVLEALKLTRGRLSLRSNLLILMDIPALIAKGLGRLPFVSAFGLSVRKFVDAAEIPSFTGISLAAEGNSVRVRMNIPATQLMGIGKIVESFMQSQGGGTAEMQTTTKPSAPTDQSTVDESENPNRKTPPAASNPSPPVKSSRRRSSKRDDDE